MGCDRVAICKIEEKGGRIVGCYYRSPFNDRFFLACLLHSLPSTAREHLSGIHLSIWRFLHSFKEERPWEICLLWSLKQSLTSTSSSLRSSSIQLETFAFCGRILNGLDINTSAIPNSENRNGHVDVDQIIERAWRYVSEFFFEERLNVFKKFRRNRTYLIRSRVYYRRRVEENLIKKFTISRSHVGRCWKMRPRVGKAGIKSKRGSQRLPKRSRHKGGIVTDRTNRLSYYRSCLFQTCSAAAPRRSRHS